MHEDIADLQGWQLFVNDSCEVVDIAMNQIFVLRLCRQSDAMHDGPHRIYVDVWRVHC